MTEEDITKEVWKAALKIHRALGPGLLESAYEECLFFELKRAGLRVERQRVLPLVYESIQLDAGYRLDLIVEEKVILELKAVECFHPVHLAQLLTYLKLSGCKLGLLMNFNVALLKLGIKRVVNNL